MKKFFGKKPVMITFIALAVVLAVVYIGMLVRPVAIGFTYKGEMDMGGEKMEMSIKVKNGSEVDVKISADGATMEFEDVRYVEHNRQIYVLMDNVGEKVSDEDFDKMKKEAIENWDELDKMGALMDANAFSVGDEEASLDCTGTVVFAIVAGVVELVLLAGAALAIVYAVKK